MKDLYIDSTMNIGAGISTVEHFVGLAAIGGAIGGTASLCLFGINQAAGYTALVGATIGLTVASVRIAAPTIFNAAYNKMTGEVG